MEGVFNRIPGVKCEIGKCCVDAAYTEDVTVIPGNPDLKSERHKSDVVLCRHEKLFLECGLTGTITAYGDEIVNLNR